MELKKHSIQELCNLISESFDLLTFFVSPTGDVLFEYLNGHGINPLYENEKQNLFNELKFVPGEAHRYPVLRKTALFENYLCISVFSDKSFLGTALIGPAVPFHLSDEKIYSLLIDYQVLKLHKQMLQYFKSLSIFSRDRLLTISVTAYYILNQELLSLETVKHNNKPFFQALEKKEKPNLTVSKNLQNGIQHHDPLAEKLQLDIVREGRVEDLKNFFKIAEEEQAGLLSKSSFIRSRKNQIIILTTLVTRAALEGGLHPEIAFTLSDTFIQRLEDLNTIDEVRSLAGEVLYTFTNKVRQIKSEKYTKRITICINYMYQHLYEEITLDQLAELIGVSPKYLSTLFKKEVGTTISEYIQQARVDESKRLLSYSETPISEIWSLLNFSDQSHFTKVFKKHVGVTPKQYREQHHLIEG